MNDTSMIFSHLAKNKTCMRLFNRLIKDEYSKLLLSFRLIEQI